MGYVVVTGASAGIGTEFARQLAASGSDLVLVARRLERLEALASELQDKHGIRALTLAADLSASDGAKQVSDFIQEQGIQPVGLINNAGFGDRGTFTALGLERQLNMVQVNVTALTDLSWRLIPLMRGQQNPFIINVASTAAFQAGPNMAVYYASKAYVLSLSEALHEELKGDGFAVSALCPGATDSEFAQEANMTDTLLFKSGTMSTESVVRTALKKRRRAIVVPGLKNLILALAVKFSPRMMTRRIAGMLQA
jgi:short-subunit dehydrogenase